MAKRNQFLFVDLASQTDGARPFDGMAAGEFVDMWGRKVNIKKEDLALYVKNTQVVLASTAGSDGEVVGLPIDGMNHDHEEAAGWITDVSLSASGSVIEFTPRWNQWGLDLISSDIVRFFSPTIDLKNKSIMGGSLTNWPATRDGKTGEILLKPIELSQGMFELADGAGGLAGALADLKEFIAGLFGGPDKTVINGGESPADQPIETGVIEMELTEQELTDRIMTAVTAALASQKPAPGQKPAADLSALLDMDGLSEEAKKQRKTELSAYIASERQAAELEWRAELARHAHESKMAELSNRVVGGTDEAPRGFRVSAEELKAHLMKLDPDEAKFWADLMTATQEKGLVEFGERGHGRTLQGTQALPPEIAESLRVWIDAGQPMAEFFRINAVELGAMSDYNLAEYQPKGAK